MQEKGDIYAMYHNTPGDTSQGFWITVLLTLIGALICAVDLFFIHAVQAGACGDDTDMCF